MIHLKTDICRLKQLTNFDLLENLENLTKPDVFCFQGV